MYPVFVNNIPKEALTSDLRSLFSKYGQVEEVTIFNNEGFVNFENSADACDAIRLLNGTHLFGSSLEVEASQELKDYLKANRHHGHYRRRPEFEAQTKNHLKNHSRSSHDYSRSSDHASRRRSGRSPSRSLKHSRRSSSRRSNDRQDYSSEKRNEDNHSHDHEGAKSRQERYSRSRSRSVSKSRRVKRDRSQSSRRRSKKRSKSKHEKKSRKRNHSSESTENKLKSKKKKKVKDKSKKKKKGKDKEKEKSKKRSKKKSKREKEESPKNIEQKSNESLLQNVLDYFASINSLSKTEPIPSDVEVTVEHIPVCKIFIGNLLNAVEKSDLENLFADFGEIVSVSLDGNCGEVELKCSLEKAKEACENYNNSMWMDNQVTVSLLEVDGSAEQLLEKTPRKENFEETSEQDDNALDQFSNGNIIIESSNKTQERLEDVFDLETRDVSAQHETSSINKIAPTRSHTVPIQPTNRRTVPTQSKKYEVVFGPTYHNEPSYFQNVTGILETVSSKVVVVKFFDGFRHRLAKFYPSQMYINGELNLGSVLKGNFFHSWPDYIKSVLQQGVNVRMDVKQLIGVPEYNDDDKIPYLASLVWSIKEDAPCDQDMCSSRSQPKSWVLKGVLMSVFPRWGVLRTSCGDVVFMSEQLFFNNAKNVSRRSLLDFVVIGDALATHCILTDYLDLSCKAAELPGFTASVETIKFTALLVWQIQAEVDPYALKASNFEEIEHCRFLATSSTLNCLLPPEHEAQHQSLTGVIEEIHPPSGGIITLDDSVTISEMDHVPELKQVYFHRSRVYINGEKLRTNTRIDYAIVPGDRVVVGIIPNNSTFATTPAYWIALSVNVASIDRGISLANALRMEVEDAIELICVGIQCRKGIDPNLRICLGRIVYLRNPYDTHGPVTEGVAVIDAGPYAGQRVEFERGQCFIFENCLSKADLSQVFNYNEVVYIQVKSYNSYLVEKLWIGKSICNSPEEVVYYRKYLFDRGLEDRTFQSLIKGIFPKRKFIPFPSTAIRGKIRCLTDNDDGAAVSVTIEAIGIGEPLLVIGERQDIYVFGHNMAKADLRYIFTNDEVLFEMRTVFEASDDNATAMPKASLVWLGDYNCRPYYYGQSSKPVVASHLHENLWKFAKSKNMDEKLFKAVVEGRVPIAQRVNPHPAPFSTDIDSETLAQATLLKQMKERFGPKACLEAIMLMMKKPDGDSDDKHSNENPDSVEAVTAITQQLINGSGDTHKSDDTESDI